MRNQQTYPAEIFFVRALLPFVAGIAATHLMRNTEWLYGIALSTAILCMLMLFLQSFYQLFELYNNRGITGLAAALFLVSSGSLVSLLHQPGYRKDFFSNNHYDFLKVRILEDPQINNRQLRLKVVVIKGYTKSGLQETVSGNLMLYLMRIDSSTQSEYAYGIEMIIPAKYQAIKAPSNPAEFDYQFWLSTQGVNHQSFVQQKNTVLLPINNGNSLIKFALNLRTRQIDYYKSLLKEKEAIAFASTLILGSRSELSRETLNIYSKTGTIHALSVSGMHVGLIYLIVNWAFQFLNRKRSLVVWKLFLILVIIWLYTLVTGFSASALRSAIMLSVFLVAKTFHKQSNGYNILAFAAFCLLVYNPFYLWDLGFQLSFLAVLGLVYLQPKLQYSLDLKFKPLRQLWSLVAISLAAQIATFPLSVYYFHQFPVYFIINNLLIALPIALLMCLGLLILILRLDFLGPLFEKLIGWTNEGLQWLAELPYSSVSSIWINKTELLFLSLAVALLCLGISDKSKTLLMSGLFYLLTCQGMMSIDQLEAAHQQKTIVFKLHGHQAKAYLSGYAAILYTDLRPGDKVYKYSIQPALDLHRIRKLRIIHTCTTEVKK